MHDCKINIYQSASMHDSRILFCHCQNFIYTIVYVKNTTLKYMYISCVTMYICIKKVKRMPTCMLHIAKKGVKFSLKKGKVYFSTSNYHIGPILDLKLQNRITYNIQLSKPDILPPRSNIIPVLVQSSSDVAQSTSHVAHLPSFSFVFLGP